MPELPEVELVARYLRPHVVGRRIASIAVTRPSYFFLSPPRILSAKLPGEIVRGLNRVGKYLLLEFETGNALLLHLGMTGQLIVAGAKSPRLVFKRERDTAKGRDFADFEPDRHTHLSIHFDDDGPTLHFRDARKFGKVCLLAAGTENPRLAKLGPDALRVSGEISVRCGAQTAPQGKIAAARSKSGRGDRQHLRR
ncbi:MAG: DNA-formamidopyrimidine glycosylase family protein [Polyangiaceae bacterium]